MEARDNRGGDGQEAESGDRDSKRSKRVENGRNGGGGVGYNANDILYISQSIKGGIVPLSRLVFRPGICPLDVLFVCVIFWDKYRNF